MIDLQITPIESILMLIVFAYFLYVTFKNRSTNNLISEVSLSKENSFRVVAFLLLGLISLIVGSNYAVIYAEKIALLLNISELVIGLTIIAIGTSLPELAATISALIKKKTDMVVGNVIGSNVLNITLVVPIVGLFSSVKLEQILLERDYLIMISLSVLFVIMATNYSSQKMSILMIRAIGILFLFGYVAYILNLSGLI